MAENLKFIHLCEMLERISRSTKGKKLKNLHKLIDFLRESRSPTEPSFYTLIRLLLPKLDNERGAYGVKEHTLAKTYIRILCLPKGGLDANKLLKFRTPTAGSSAGDFADVAYWVLKSRCRDGGKLSVQEVDSNLDKIALLHANNKPREVDNELTNNLLKMSAEEQKWLIRLLLKDLRLGISPNSILNAIHPDAKELFNVSNNLKKVCEKLQDPSKRLHEIEVSLFEPCCPMLSEKCDILTVQAVLSDSPFYYVEKKHDGERFQIHINNGSFRYFSRKGFDFTGPSFGESSKSGTLTPLLMKQLRSDVKTCILDGEMMVWNSKLKCFGSKAMNLDVKYLKEGDLHRPCFCVFDVLMLNGEVLTNKPVKDRIQVLQKVFTPLEGVIMDTPRKCVTSSSEVVAALNEAIDNQEEGLILKNPHSIYKPAARLGGWHKIKPEYTIGLTEELDLLILGGYYGEGRITHFLMGVAVAPTVEGATPVEFHSVGRVGSGYSKEELAELLEKLSPYWKRVRNNHMPDGLFWTKERPDLYIEPSSSQILQVKATEIVKSDHYKTGYTLRFPRVEKVRYDKKWTECCTTADFDKLRLMNCGKLATKHVTTELPSISPKKRRKTKAAPVVGRDYQAADLGSAEQKGSLLSGKEICVLSGNRMVSKQDLEKRVHEQGGIVVQHRGPETFCVVSGKDNFHLKNIMAKGDIDVVTVDWLLRVIDEEKLLEWEPQDLLAMSSRTQAEMELKYDSFYDSFHHPTSEGKLKVSLEKVFTQGCAINLLPSEMGDLDVELFSGINEFAIFRCCAAHFSMANKVQTFHRNISEAMFKFQGGRISGMDSSDLTHVVIEKDDTVNFKIFRDLNQRRLKKFYLVTYEWIESCWLTKCRLNEVDFYPKSLLDS